MGQTKLRNELLRILLADDNDVNAFVLQCAINRLSQPCAFQRVDKEELLPEKIQGFRPEWLIAAGRFAAPPALKMMRQLTNGRPIICLVETMAEAEASLAAGAVDGVLLSQQHELGACLERHLKGEVIQPFFRMQRATRPKRLEKVESRLQELDRWLGQSMRRAWMRSRQFCFDWARHAQRFSRDLRAKIAARMVEFQNWRRRQTQRKQASAGPVVRTPANGHGHSELWADRLDSEPIPAMSSRLDLDRDEHHSLAKLRAHPDEDLRAEENSEALRTLELSFKTLFHTAIDPMFLMDGMGAFLHANAAGCALLGRTAADLLRRTLLEFVPADETARISAVWEALLIEGQQKGEMQLICAKDEVKEVQFSGRANLWFGVHLLMVRDVTELRKLRRELDALHQTSTGPLGTGMA